MSDHGPGEPLRLLRFAGAVRMGPVPAARSPYAYHPSYDPVVRCEHCPAPVGAPSLRFCAVHRAAHAERLAGQIRSVRDAFLARTTQPQGQEQGR